MFRLFMDSPASIYETEIQKEFLYSEEYIYSLDLSEEEIIIAKAWREKILSEQDFQFGRNLQQVNKFFVNLGKIAKGETIVVCHKQSYYSRPEDYIISNCDVTDPESYRGTMPLVAYDNYRPVSFEVLQLSKEVEIAPDKVYLGSYYSEGYPVDVYKSLEDGIYCHSNFYTSWNNSQVWGKSLDRGLKVPRFFIENGSEELFEEDNRAIEEEKRVKREYFLGVMKAAQYAFGISWDGAKSLLDEIGTVKGLATLVDVYLMDLSNKDLDILSKKRSNLALENFFKKRPWLNYPDAKLADITIAAEKLLEM